MAEETSKLFQKLMFKLFETHRETIEEAVSDAIINGQGTLAIENAGHENDIRVQHITPGHTYERARSTQAYFAANPSVVNRPYRGDFVPDVPLDSVEADAQRQEMLEANRTCPQCQGSLTAHDILLGIYCASCLEELVNGRREVDYAEMDGMTLDEGFIALTKIVEERKHG